MNFTLFVIQTWIIGWQLSLGHQVSNCKVFGALGFLDISESLPSGW
jgi:uncharacterized membrane protein YedE/YeeE